MEKPEVGPSDSDKSQAFYVRPIVPKLPSPRPLFVGHSSLLKDGQIIVVGGGAVCFSFGTHWNTTPIIFAPATHLDKGLRVTGGTQLGKKVYLLRPIQTFEAPTKQFTNTNDSSRSPPQADTVLKGKLIFVHLLKS